MATTLKSIVRFVNVEPDATVALPHGIEDGFGRPVVPDRIEASVAGFVIDADEVEVEVTNTSDDPASVDVLCELWHTLERAFGAEETLELTPRPFIQVPGGDGGATAIRVEGDGVLVGLRSTINFAGDQGVVVSVTDNPGESRVDVVVGPPVPVALVDGASIEIDSRASNQFTLARGDAPGDAELAFPDPAPIPGSTWQIDVTQAAPGGHLLDFAAGYTGGDDGLPTLSLGSGVVDILTFKAISAVKVAVFIAPGY